jgi:hypothetical protein
MAKNTIHPINLESPSDFSEGRDIRVPCKATVTHAVTAFTWDEPAMGQMISQWGPNVCKVCAAKSDEQNEGRRYVYGIRNGQEEREVKR